MSGSDSSAYGETFAGDYDRWWGNTFPLKDMAETLASLARGGKALELGIGTGLVALALAERGVSVSGIDASPAMVAKMREKPGGADIPVAIGDMADVPIEGTFSLAFVTFSTFFLLPSQEAQLRCIRNTAAHLDAGGRLLIEASVNPFGADEKPLRVMDSTPDELLMLAGSYDAVNQISCAHHLQFGAHGTKSWPLVMRFCSPGELDLMARLAGMRLEHRWGDWKRLAPGKGTRRLVSVYVKE